MGYVVLCALWVLLCCCWCISGEGNPVAYSKFGKIEGIYKDGLDTFLGIPYAIPPVGPLRWKPPRAFYLKGNEYKANTESPICPQFGYFFPNTTFNENEDCLYLNIYTKHSSPRTRKPVLFWIHGGSLIFGSAYMYNAQNLAKSMDVVVVTFNYRLNAFGFLALKELNWGDPRGVSGNYGIMDQQLALSWVKENIAAFGGDPYRVTILGQSSGGTSVYALLSSPASRGLFHAAISVSGSPNITMDFKEVNKQNRVFLTSSNCANLGAKDTLDCIYGLSTAEVLQATPAAYNFIPLAYPFPSDKRVGMQYPGVVYVDGVTVKYSFLKAITKPIIDVPLLLQSVSNELQIYNGNQFNHLSNGEMKQFITSSITPGFGARAGEEIAYAYFSNGHTNDYNFNQLISDIGVICANREVSLRASKAFRSPVYLVNIHHTLTTPYSNPFFPGMNMSDAFHLTDWWAAADNFDMLCLDGCAECCGYQEGEDERRLGRVIREMWYMLAARGSLYGSGCKSVDFGSLEANWCLPSPRGFESSNTYKNHQCDVLKWAGFDDSEWWCD